MTTIDRTRRKAKPDRIANALEDIAATLKRVERELSKPKSPSYEMIRGEGEMLEDALVPPGELAPDTSESSR